jgi:hypothetical protein
MQLLPFWAQRDTAHLGALGSGTFSQWSISVIIKNLYRLVF